MVTRAYFRFTGSQTSAFGTVKRAKQICRQIPRLCFYKVLLLNRTASFNPSLFSNKQVLMDLDVENRESNLLKVLLLRKNILY